MSDRLKDIKERHIHMKKSGYMWYYGSEIMQLLQANMDYLLELIDELRTVPGHKAYVAEEGRKGEPGQLSDAYRTVCYIGPWVSDGMGGYSREVCDQFGEKF